MKRSCIQFYICKEWINLNGSRMKMIRSNSCVCKMYSILLPHYLVFHFDICFIFVLFWFWVGSMKPFSSCITTSHYSTTHIHKNYGNTNFILLSFGWFMSLWIEYYWMVWCHKFYDTLIFFFSYFELIIFTVINTFYNTSALFILFEFSNS